MTSEPSTAEVIEQEFDSYIEELKKSLSTIHDRVRHIRKECQISTADLEKLNADIEKRK